MTTWKPDTCECELLELGEDGEPIAFIGARCERHQTAEPAEVMAENRAKNVALVRSGLEPDQAVWGFNDGGLAVVGTLDLASGTLVPVASSPPLTSEGAEAAINA